jgi:excisionase family DNA binding protein
MWHLSSRNPFRIYCCWRAFYNIHQKLCRTLLTTPSWSNILSLVERLAGLPRLGLRSSQSGGISNVGFKFKDQENMTESKLLDIPAVCTRLSLSRSTVYTLINKGEFQTIKIGTRRMTHSTEIDRYIQNLEQRNYHYGDRDWLRSLWNGNFLPQAST